jgi:hypothetical protein
MPQHVPKTGAERSWRSIVCSISWICWLVVSACLGIRAAATFFEDVPSEAQFVRERMLWGFGVLISCAGSAVALYWLAAREAARCSHVRCVRFHLAGTSAVLLAGPVLGLLALWSEGPRIVTTEWWLAVLALVVLQLPPLLGMLFSRSSNPRFAKLVWVPSFLGGALGLALFVVLWICNEAGWMA